MLLIYGESRRNSSAAGRMYRQRFLQRRLPNRRTFVTVSQRLLETGSLERVRNNWTRRCDTCLQNYCGHVENLIKIASELDEGDNAGEMNPGSSTKSFPAFAHIGLRENPGKNLNQASSEEASLTTLLRDDSDLNEGERATVNCSMVELFGLLPLLIAYDIVCSVFIFRTDLTVVDQSDRLVVCNDPHSRFSPEDKRDPLLERCDTIF
ncbi:hypothetical protein ANN_02916 [Periplaneta americana]|uniref:DUF4817 domain-containing protein n=1 Tax=Periplaneta americana TaxID=6978 RepID=A0ABQ8TXL2_PERAM|nr:hypothetical protein ANN_02916 [Periplaneta americana]